MTRRPALFLTGLIFGALLPVVYLEWLALHKRAHTGCRSYWHGSSTLRVLDKESAGVPFDPSFYTSFYADLGSMNEAEAEKHYRQVGRFEGRLAAPVDLRFKYIACGGLCNQLYSHIHALIIARAMGASLLLAPAMQRKSFGDVRTGLDGKTTTVEWEFAPVEGLLDVERMRDYWRKRGLELLPTPPIRETVDPKTRAKTHVYYGSLPYDLPFGERCLTAGYLQPERPFRLVNYMRQARSAITAVAQPVLKGDPTNQIPCVYLETHCTFLSLNTSRIIGRATEAAMGLFFNTTLVSLADRVVAALDPRGEGFNGLHLRLERDARDWFDMVKGGQEGLKGLFYAAMRSQGFSRTTSVYVASGLKTYDADGELERIRDAVTEQGLAKTFLFKEELLPEGALKGLHPEQLALVDFLVLLKSRQLVGWGGSSFSVLLRELRAADGVPRATTHLIYPPGLDGPLGRANFEAAGVLS